jgi:hypothetical protein
MPPNRPPGRLPATSVRCSTPGGRLSQVRFSYGAPCSRSKTVKPDAFGYCTTGPLTVKPPDTFGTSRGQTGRRTNALRQRESSRGESGIITTGRRAAAVRADARLPLRVTSTAIAKQPHTREATLIEYSPTAGEGGRVPLLRLTGYSRAHWPRRVEDSPGSANRRDEESGSPEESPHQKPRHNHRARRARRVVSYRRGRERQ